MDDELYVRHRLDRWRSLAGKSAYILLNQFPKTFRSNAKRRLIVETELLCMPGPITLLP
jgi:hypothetical protein